MLALPAHPGLLRQRFFHDRCGVDEQLDLTGIGLCHPTGQLAELLFDHIMIVTPSLGIGADRAAVQPLQHGERIDLWPIIQPHHDGGARARPHCSRVGAAVRGCGHPVHVAMAAFAQIQGEARPTHARRTGWRKADSVEAQF